MISISGIRYQEKLELLPYFNKKAASLLIGKEGRNLDKKMGRLVEMGYLIVLKKGLYVTSAFLDKTNRELYSEYIANVLRVPSYVSLEYVLAKEGLIPETVFGITSLTVKTPRDYTSALGNFIYKNIKAELFTGYARKEWQDKVIYTASRAKALFDFLYLKSMPKTAEGVADLRVNWDNFGKNDLAEFCDYVDLSKSKKMFSVLVEIKSLNHVS